MTTEPVDPVDVIITSDPNNPSNLLLMCSLCPEGTVIPVRSGITFTSVFELLTKHMSRDHSGSESTGPVTSR